MPDLWGMRNVIPGMVTLTIMTPIILIVGCRHAGFAPSLIQPEQRQIVFRQPESLPQEPVDTFVDLRTVAHPGTELPQFKIALDEAIRIALKNSQVVRVLAGNTAVSSGQTIYDPGISNTAIDQARGRFDPIFSMNNTFGNNETPIGTLSFLPPFATINGTSTNSYIFDSTLSQTNPTGGIASLKVGATRTDLYPGLLPLDPQTNSFTELSYVQPLLQGGGITANGAPILIASIETERSFFQFKGSIQELTRGVTEAFWSLVAARTERWARQQQVDQGEFAYNREVARKERGLGDLANVSQSRVTLANFRSNLVLSKSNVIQREAALLNILGIPPTAVGEVVPITPPFKDTLTFNWSELVEMAQQQRPDVVELKLILEADLQRVVVAQNNAQPRLDGVAAYRWDGLNGTTLSGTSISTQGGEYTDWTLGVNFSVPLGLRQGRANVRQQELIVARDRANLRQGVFNATHQVARSLRNIDQYYEQYQAFMETREAARDNLLVQQSEFANGRTIFLNVLLAIVDWGNAVSAEAQALSQYNTELANLELQTGTILEAHGIRFMEERFRFVGPWNKFHDVCYPGAIVPSENVPRYPVGEAPAEESFNLVPPTTKPSTIPPEPSSTIEGANGTTNIPLTPEAIGLEDESTVNEAGWRLFIP